MLDGPGKCFGVCGRMGFGSPTRPLASGSPRTTVGGEAQGTTVPALVNAQGLLKMQHTGQSVTGSDVGRISRPFFLPVAVAAALMLSACGTAPWVKDAPRSPSPGATSSQLAKVHGDLANGSVKRRLVAGGVTLDVSYWSTLKPEKWTAAVDKPLFVSFVGSAASPVYASSVTMTAFAYRESTQVSQKPIAMTDAATVQPGYAVSSPYSYTGLFTIPAVPSKATSLIIQFTYVLLQTAEPTGGFAKSTTTDTVTIAIVQ